MAFVLPKNQEFYTFPREVCGFLQADDSLPCLTNHPACLTCSLIFLLWAHSPSSETHHKVHFWKTSKSFLHLPCQSPASSTRPQAGFLGPAQHWLFHLSLADFKIFKHGENRYFPRQLLHMWQGSLFNKGFQKQPSASELCKTLLYKKLASPLAASLVSSSCHSLPVNSVIKHFAPNYTRH